MRLRLWTLVADGREIKHRSAIWLEVNAHGLVTMHALDSAYEPLMLDLMREGMWSQELGRTATVDDGLDFLKAVEASLITSSYWHSEWVSMEPVRDQNRLEFTLADVQAHHEAWAEWLGTFEWKRVKHVRLGRRKEVNAMAEEQMEKAEEGAGEAEKTGDGNGNLVEKSADEGASEEKAPE